MKPLIQVIGLGLLTGSRTWAASAILSRRLNDHAPAERRGLVWVLGSPRTAKLLRLLATGEFIGDKLPGVPARTSAPALAARGVMGGLVGWVLGGLHGRSRLIGAALGASSAVAGAFIGYHWRTNTAADHDLPDPALAVWEDTLVLAGGRVLARFTPNGHREPVISDPE